MKKREQSKSCFDYAVGLLAARAYTTERLRKKLQMRGHAPEDVNEVLERLIKGRALDDSRYAAEYARQRLRAGVSVRRIRQELVRKGIAPARADDAVQLVSGEENVDRSHVIRRLAMRKLASLSRFDDLTRRRRVFAFLLRKGYETDDVNLILASLSRDGEL